MMYFVVLNRMEQSHAHCLYTHSILWCQEQLALAHGILELHLAWLVMTSAYK